VDLVAGGAELAGLLRPGQARIALLAALLATPGGGDARETLRQVLTAAPQSLPASELYLVDGVGH
jgi:L-asparaginase